MKVRIGVGVVSSTDRSLASGPALAELVDESERRGIDSLWLSDQASSAHHVDPLIGLAYAAGRTEKLKLGTGVLVLPGRNPALVAAQLAGLAATAPGRILPAFGVQPATVSDRTMYPVPPGQRGAVFEEALSVVRALLTEPSVTFEGSFFHLDEATVGPRPAKPLDLWLGGRLPVSMSRIGRLADGWLGSFVTPGEAADCRRQIEAAASEAGREVEPDHYGTNLIVAPHGSDDTAVDTVITAVARRRKDLADPQRLVCRGWDEARSELGRFVDAGITKFVVRPVVPVESIAEFLDQMADELLPLQT